MSVAFGSGFTVVSESWTSFKTAKTVKNLNIQYLEESGTYTIYGYDGPNVHTCTIWTGVVPDGVVAGGYTQEQNDSNKADFEANYKSCANAPLEPRTIDGRLRTANEKSDNAKVTFFTHDWTDKTTWTTKATRVVAEVASRTSAGVYQLAHANVIDTYHGKITGEDFLKDVANNSYRITVKVDGATKTEQDPHSASGGDYVFDYIAGTISFLADPGESVVVEATYHYATTSEFVIKPAAGKKLFINFAECQFSQDVVINDTVVFQAYGYVDFFAPQYLQANGGPYPSGTKIPLGNPTKYKGMRDYYNESVKTYPAYPALGGNGWRGISVPTVVCDWDYLASTPVSSAAGMEIVVSLEHHSKFGGAMATATFYCTVETE